MPPGGAPQKGLGVGVTGWPRCSARGGSAGCGRCSKGWVPQPLGGLWGWQKKKGKMAFLSPFLSAEGVVGLWVLVVLWVLLGFVVVSSVFLLAVLSILCQRG